MHQNYKFNNTKYGPWRETWPGFRDQNFPEWGNVKGIFPYTAGKFRWRGRVRSISSKDAIAFIDYLTSMATNMNFGLIAARMAKGIRHFMYRRPTLYPLEIAVDFLKSP
jgi:hypothetical protein